MTRATDFVFLSSRRFTGDLQAAFSRLSGDHNPMHDDPVLARRTIVGAQVVHGMHQVIAAIEAALGHGPGRGSPRGRIAGLKAVFKRPVLVDETLSFFIDRTEPQRSGIAGKIHEETFCDISIRWDELPEPPWLELPPPEAVQVAELEFPVLEGMSGTIPLELDTALAREMFPLAMSLLGPLGMAEILGLSRLVGMHCPGMHSVFGRFDVHFRGSAPDGLLHYRVAEADERFGKVAILVNGPRVEGELAVFFRPPAERPPSMSDVAPLVEAGCYARSVALIVGGSRGLGEVTARLIAAGGGLPVITYHQGGSDAERVAADIRSVGARCEVLHLDVRNPGSFPPNWGGGGRVPRSLYYFATPKIFGRRRGFFDRDLLREFHEVYVTAFGRLIDHVAASSGRLRVFYPSSVAVTESIPELAEYAIAKQAGEEVCAFYNRFSRKMEIIVERLPRIRTDQTLAIVPARAVSSLEVMLSIVKSVENGCQGSRPNENLLQTAADFSWMLFHE